MDQKVLVKQMVQMNKAAFDSSFNAMALLQEQAEKFGNSLMSQANWIPEEGRAAIHNWINAFKHGRDEFKKNVDENFNKVETYFTKTPE